MSDRKPVANNGIHFSLFICFSKSIKFIYFVNNCFLKNIMSLLEERNQNLNQLEFIKVILKFVLYNLFCSKKVSGLVTKYDGN